IHFAEKLLVNRLHRTSRNPYAEQTDVAHVEVAITAGDADDHTILVEIAGRHDSEFVPSRTPALLDGAAEKGPVERRHDIGKHLADIAASVKRPAGAELVVDQPWLAVDDHAPSVAFAAVMVARSIAFSEISSPTSYFPPDAVRRKSPRPHHLTRAVAADYG